jgi:PAS domain S-box-containing protein
VENSGDLAGDLAQVQQMIQAHAAAAQQKVNVSLAIQPPIAPSMPGTTAIAPAPPSRGGMPMTVPRMNTSVPASLAPAIQGGPMATHHMHHAPIPATKRKRADTAATSNKTITTMNMHGFPQGIPPRNGRQKSQAQIDRRRERNRILARRTRLRKKFFFESLQKDVSDLQKENVALKEVVRTKLEPEKAKALLDNCDAIERLPSDIAETFGIGELDRRDFSLINSIQKSQQCFVITDPSLQDNPIVYASDDFLTVTGYSRDDVLGRNCRFLQGTETSADKVESIRKAISQGEDISVCFINYTADGTAFWNKLFIAALRDAQNNIVNFIGVTVKVAGPEPGDPEAGKLLPGEAEGEYDSGSEIGSGPMSGINDADAMAKAAEGTVMAIEGVVSAAFAGAPGLRS